MRLFSFWPKKNHDCGADQNKAYDKGYNKGFEDGYRKGWNGAVEHVKAHVDKLEKEVI